MDGSKKRLILKKANIPAVFLAPEYVSTGSIRSWCLILQSILGLVHKIQKGDRISKFSYSDLKNLDFLNFLPRNPDSPRSDERRACDTPRGKLVCILGKRKSK